eukprot:scaffold182133_cov35-Prasinocladus_malaysianus.AAC.1
MVALFAGPAILVKTNQSFNYPSVRCSRRARAPSRSPLLAKSLKAIHWSSVDSWMRSTSDKSPARYWWRQQAQGPRYTNIINQ